MITDVRFYDRLLLEWPLDETDEFVLAHAFRVSWKMDQTEVEWTVPAGMKTDLASIPKIVPKWISQKIDRHIPAAVVHDHLCKMRPWTSQIAAEVFDAAMKALYVADWKRHAMYRAVSLFGPRW